MGFLIFGSMVIVVLLEITDKDFGKISREFLREDLIFSEVRVKFVLRHKLGLDLP